MKNYNWATLGCGVIANELAAALKSRGQKLYSVANRTHEKAVAFAEKYGIEKVYNDIDELFKDENVDIISGIRRYANIITETIIINAQFPIYFQNFFPR